jgi:hypothetical protein
MDSSWRVSIQQSAPRAVTSPNDQTALSKLNCGILILALVPLTFHLVGCAGAVGSQSANGAVSAAVVVTPASAQPFTGVPVKFSATAQNAANSTVTWRVNDVAGGNATIGTIDSTGGYLAPNAVPSPATVTVTAALQADPTVSGSASVNIRSPSSIQGPLSVSPVLASVTTSQPVQFQVTTAGVANNLLTWSVDGFSNGSAAIGTITANGLYTPSTVAGSHTIVAAVKANTSALGSATAAVTDLAGVFTWRNDNSRSGQNRREFALAPTTISPANFGKLFSCPLDGFTYTQPLYVANLAIPGMGTHNVVFVGTEKDSVYAFDADANPCVQLWRMSLIPSGEEAVPLPNFDLTNTDSGPLVGITGTPVIEASSSTLFVVTKTRTIALNPIYHQMVYALDLATGQIKIRTSGIQLATPANASPPFSPLWENQRAALLLDNKTLYVAFGSDHDQGDFHGWIITLDASTLIPTAFFTDTPGGQQGGIAQSGGGPSADSNHNIYAIAGHGTFDVNRGGHNYANSFLRLAPAAALAITDFFAPCDQAALASAGQDLGSSAPFLLPAFAGPPSHPNLILGASANGSMYVLDRDALGGYSGGFCPDNSPRPLQVIPIHDGPILSTPLFWNNGAFVAAGNGKLKYFPLTSGALAQSPLTAQSPESLGTQGATPALSSNGTSNAIVWLVDSSGAQAAPNTPAILRAYDANNLSNEIYNSAIAPGRDSAGLALDATVPTVANGKVYIGTQGELDVYGLLGQ